MSYAECDAIALHVIISVALSTANHRGLHVPLCSSVVCEALLLSHLVQRCKLAGKLCLLADDLKLSLQVQRFEYNSSCQVLIPRFGTLRRAPLTSALLLTWNSTCTRLPLNNLKQILRALSLEEKQYLSVALVESGHLPLFKAGKTPPELLRLDMRRLRRFSTHFLVHRDYNWLGCSHLRLLWQAPSSAPCESDPSSFGGVCSTIQDAVDRLSCWIYLPVAVYLYQLAIRLSDPTALQLFSTLGHTRDQLVPLQYPL